MHNMKWYSVPRSSLPDTIHGFAVPQSELSQLKSDATGIDGLAIGFPEVPSPTTPAVLGLVDASTAADLFSWLSTFAPEAFPISQAFRVMTFADWEAGVDSLATRPRIAKDAIWPSLILGEILGQGEREHDLASIPLSRVFASFTYAQARAHLLYERNSALVQQCRERLQLLEADTSFVRRAIGVSELSVMWELAGGPGDEKCHEIIQFVASVVAGAKENRAGPFPAVFEQLGLNVQAIASDSIEERVLEFERVAKRLEASKARESEAALALAALAMLVGRRTTHLTLLDEYAKVYPTAISWFALLAGLLGPEVWDEKWMRFSTSVERLLRSSVTLNDPPTADLCWVEYSWIRGLRQSAAWMKETPKMYPRVLSVELLPGVTCQLRLQDNTQATSKIATAIVHSVETVQKGSSKSAWGDVGKDRRLNLLAQMKAELLRMTETMAKLETEERQQGELFNQESPSTLPSGASSARKPSRKTSEKKTQKRAS